MSNLETKPRELTCEEVAARAPGRVQLLAPRDVPLGGPRAMNVRRTLPQKERSLIGGWCFLDHYGPDEVAETGGMTVPPHPHTGLQTVSWLFTGEIEHRDSAGFHAMVRPGELNLMTAGRGISHSEVSTPETSILHGVQLWVALPSAARFTDPGFVHYAPEPVSGDGFEARVFLGTLLGAASPVRTHSPLVGVEVLLHAGSSLRVAVEPSYEHGVLVDRGAVAVGGTVIGSSHLGYLPPGRDSLKLSAVDSAGPDGAPARFLLLGGEPLGESIVMWWNFVGRSHEEIVRFRANWQAQFEPSPGEPAEDPSQFGTVIGEALPALRAPTLPNARLRPRG